MNEWRCNQPVTNIGYNGLEPDRYLNRKKKEIRTLLLPFYQSTVSSYLVISTVIKMYNKFATAHS